MKPVHPAVWGLTRSASYVTCQPFLLLSAGTCESKVTIDVDSNKSTLSGQLY